MKNTITLLLLFITFQLTSQTFSELPSMPEPVSNNAVTSAMVNGVPHVYSFSGIDSTKIFSGIHKRAFRYNTLTQVWDVIAPLPSGNGRIAAGASTVKNKIYIMGGYEVFANGGEASFDNTHIYNPETNSYEPDGAPIPVPIDDHVQAVWRDSLIYVVTGWSNTGNVPDVQIYNPSDDTWMVGTSVPNNTLYKVFGAAGVITGDTIFYLGGAKMQTNFPISNYLRKGVIDPNNPTDITWSTVDNAIGIGYRPAAWEIYEGEIIWLGGSETTYNYNGIAYNGTGGVEPRTTWYRYNYNYFQLFMPNTWNAMPEVMDLRGIANVDDDYAIIAGGMIANQTVSDKVFAINPYQLLSNNNISNSNIKISPNPAIDFFTIEKEGKFDVELWSTSGQLIFNKKVDGFQSIDIINQVSGIYFIKIFENEKWIGTEKLIVR